MRKTFFDVKKPFLKSLFRRTCKKAFMRKILTLKTSESLLEEQAKGFQPKNLEEHAKSFNAKIIFLTQKTLQILLKFFGR